MSSQNPISATLSEETKQEVLQKLTEIQTKLDFLISLEADDIRSIFKAENDFIPFIDKAYNKIINYPQILPPVFNVEEFKKDYHLIKALSLIVDQIKEIADSL